MNKKITDKIKSIPIWKGKIDFKKLDVELLMKIF